MSTKIVPAINVDSVELYQQQIRIVRQLTDRYQVDIIDGEYVDNHTVMPEDIHKPVDAKMDIHLMVLDVLGFISRCISLNPHTIIFQFDALRIQRDVVACIDAINSAGFRSGIALNPDVEVASIAKFLPKLNHVLVMGYPAGFSGQKLQREVLEKPAQIRALAPAIEIGLDGGLNHNTIKVIAKADFDVVNTSTYLFQNPEKDPLSVYSELLGELI